ncbi:MAG: GNAT family N-acetyltransferase, partial [Sciscionella sp.]
MLVPEFPLRTTRLLLRPYRETDLDFVHDVQSRPEVARFVYWPPRDRDQARESLRMKMAATALRAEGDSLTPLIELAGTGEPIGDVLLHWTSEAHSHGEIGYVIHPRHAGRGYATEAAGLMLRLGFT